MSQFSTYLIGGMAGALALSVILGLLMFVLAPAIGRFFKTAPNDKQMAEFDKRYLQESQAQAQKPIFSMNARKEPIVIALLGFIATFALASVFVTIPPEKVNCELPENKEVAECKKPKIVVLPIKGNFEEIVSQLPAGNAANGKEIYNSTGCVGCHTLEKDKVQVGPSFYGVYTRAATRVSGENAKAYIYRSIVVPNDFIVPNFQANLMPQNFSTQLNAQQVADLLAWMEKDLAQKD
jgi:cytochrome c551/c552